MPSPAIEIDSLSLAIDDQSILRNVSLSVAAGESVSIIGPNGAGKSSLLRCLDRLERRCRGKVAVFGKPLERYAQKELAAVMSYVPQMDGQSLPFTVFEFVLMGRYPHLGPWQPIGVEHKQVVQDTLSLTGTAELSERLVSTLSGGERQQVSIAAALAQQPKILLLDEPTTFLDYKHQDEVGRLLRKINREQERTVVSVSHDINQASLLSERVVALKAGEVVFDGPTVALMNNEILQRVYDKEFQFVAHPESGRQMIVPREMGP